MNINDVDVYTLREIVARLVADNKIKPRGDHTAACTDLVKEVEKLEGENRALRDVLRQAEKRCQQAEAEARAYQEQTQALSEFPGLAALREKQNKQLKEQVGLLQQTAHHHACQHRKARDEIAELRQENHRLNVALTSTIAEHEAVVERLVKERAAVVETVAAQLREMGFIVAPASPEGDL